MARPEGKSSWFPHELYDYLTDNWLREPPLLARLREETAAMPNAGMQISPEQGQVMAILAKLMGARRCLEVGVFTGYSSLSVALALPPEGRIVACDVSAEFTSVARRYWVEAGVDSQIDLRLGPATDTLQTLLHEGAVQFDLMFIDADKANYDRYYELGLKLVRPGGAILIDNVFWHDKVLDLSDQSEDTLAIRALNTKLHTDERIDLAILPIGDGVTLARKR